MPDQPVPDQPVPDQPVPDQPVPDQSVSDQPGVPAVDTRFVLPNLDATAQTEVGVILLGLDAARLLAGLGTAVLSDDPGRVAVTVDRLRHGVAAFDAAALAADGARYWRGVRAVLAAAYPDPPSSADLRGSFERANRAFGPDLLGEVGLATRTYLVACWLRRADVDPAADQPPDPAI